MTDFYVINGILRARDPRPPRRQVGRYYNAVDLDTTQPTLLDRIAALPYELQMRILSFANNKLFDAVTEQVSRTFSAWRRQIDGVNRQLRRIVLNDQVRRFADWQNRRPAFAVFRDGLQVKDHTRLVNGSVGVRESNAWWWDPGSWAVRTRLRDRFGFSTVGPDANRYAYMDTPYAYPMPPNMRKRKRS